MVRRSWWSSHSSHKYGGLSEVEGAKILKKHVRKIKYCFTQYDRKAFFHGKNLFSMENGEVYGRFVLIFCVFDFDYTLCI